MPQLVWDNVGERVYESGIDRGVLYLPDGSAVPWNGLREVTEHFNKEISPVYYEGSKIGDIIALVDFSATLKAITYPDDFLELEGLANPRPGMFLGDQKPKRFGLSYRTRIGNDTEGPSVGYKLHLIYNVIATPSDKTNSSVSEDPGLSEFEWSLSSVPEDLPGFRPTAHLILDSRELDPLLLESVENSLYGTEATSALLVPMSEVVAFLIDWARVSIIDHGDGTWTAVSNFDGYISVDINDMFTLTNVNATFLDSTTYEISNTIDDLGP